MHTTFRRIGALEQQLTDTMADHAIPLLRVSLGVTYIWFGALKLVGASPVGDFAARTVPFLPRRFFVPFLGIWEVAIGLALLLRVALRPTLVLFALQLLGTFLSLAVQPRRTFEHGNPLLLTQEGEFVIKNLVLLAAGIAVGTTINRDSERLPRDDSELRAGG